MRRLIPLLLAALPALASTITNAQIDGFGTNIVSGSAIAYYIGSIAGDPLSISGSATATATTLGPVRDGFLEITGSGSGDFGGGTVSIGAYSFACDIYSCSPSANLNGSALPFTLGVPFQVSIDAYASAFGPGSGAIQFQFSVFEKVDFGPFTFAGASVEVLDPQVPEPATILLCGGGLALLLAGRRIRNTRKP